jgi:hypothetical protein
MPRAAGLIRETDRMWLVVLDADVFQRKGQSMVLSWGSCTLQF